MKVGFVLDDSLDRGDGVQQYILSLGGWMSRNGHEVHYLVGQTKTRIIPNVHSLSQNVAVRFNGNRLTVPLPADKPAIKSLLEQEQFDVLHIQMPYSPFMAGRIIKLAPPTTNLVGTFHIMPFGRLQSFSAKALAWWTRRSTARLSTIWSVSEPAQDFAKSLGIQSDIMPNVIDLARYKKASTKPGKQFTIVFLGRLVERKGCLELLKAVEVMFLNKQSVKLVIAGNGPQADFLRSWVKRRKMTAIVDFKGYVSEADKPDLLASANLAVFPSLGGESFGIVLLEAMAAGAEVVLGGNNPGYASVLGSIPQSLFDPRNTLELVGVMQNLHDDDKLRRSIHSQQQKLVKQYDTSHIAKKLLSYYVKQ